jgi:hypothetical protein
LENEILAKKNIWELSYSRPMKGYEKQVSLPETTDPTQTPLIARRIPLREATDPVQTPLIGAG